MRNHAEVREVTKLEHALALAARGFKVFPIKPGQKAPPLLAGWPERATSDPAVIAEYWAPEPNANIGIHCVDMIVIDASFISLRLVLPAALRFAEPDTDTVALVKPQFEVGKGKVQKGGVVRDPDLHAEVLANMNTLVGEVGRSVRGLTPSPITGQKKGNVEFLLWLR
jgi:hypothetical protein